MTALDGINLKEMHKVFVRTLLGLLSLFLISFPQLFIPLSPSHTYEPRVCKIATLCSEGVAGRWQPVWRLFFSQQCVLSSIICSRCQKRCHNMIMRLHAFSGDSSSKTPSWGDPTGTIYRHEMAVEASRSPADEDPARGQAAEEPGTSTGRTDFYAQRSPIK